MKDKKILVNIDRDAVCFAVAVLILAGIGATVAWDVAKAEEIPDAAPKEVVRDTLENCDGTCFDTELPARTNTGDTLRVIGKSDVRKNVLVAAPLRGRAKEYKIKGVETVRPGDTIVFNKKHKFLMKNITQRNLEKQK